LKICGCLFAAVYLKITTSCTHHWQFCLPTACTVIECCFCFIWQSKLLSVVTNFCSCIFVTGGWWPVEKFDDITGAISIEIGSMQYLQAQDNGLFIVGPQHDIGTCAHAHDTCTSIL